jgi:hypothetical protein
MCCIACRQIESMAAAASLEQAAARQTEADLRRSVSELQQRLGSAMEGEKVAKARAVAAERAMAAAKGAAASAGGSAAEITARFEAEQATCRALRATLQSMQAAAKDAEATASQQLAEREAEVQELHERLWESEEGLRGALRQLNALAKDIAAMQSSGEGGNHSGSGQKEAVVATQEAQQVGTPILTATSTPPPEDELDGLVQSWAKGSSHACLHMHASSGHGLAGSAVKLLEQQLHMAEHARDAANAALLAAVERAEAGEAATRRVVQLERAVGELRTRLGLSLELLGERNERIEQLEDDVSEMKRIFHQQLDVAATQLHDAQRQLAAVEQQR